MASEPGPEDEFVRKVRAVVQELIDPLRSDIADIRTDIADLRADLGNVGTDVAALRDDVTAIGRESEIVAAQMAITRNSAARVGGFGVYRATAKVPPPTQAAQSGFSFDPIHRSPFGPRYG